jgi:GNAT superfamily N-acetyltransferase
VGVSVRIAGDGDMAVVAALRRAWNEEDLGAAIEDGDFDAAFAAWWEAERATRTFFVVDVDGEAVGMANIKRYNRMPMAGRSSAGWWGYVGNVFVLPNHRNAGVGRALMDALVAWAGAAGMAHLRLAPSDASASFYRRLGFAAGSVVELDPPASRQRDA